MAIARSLVKDPKLRPADEPAGNLDEGTRDEIITLQERMSAGRGLTIVLVTGGSAIARRSPRRAVICQGHLARPGRRPQAASSPFAHGQVVWASILRKTREQGAQR